MTFDQKNEGSVKATIISVYTHLDQNLLPALAKTAHFQKKMVDLLYEKLQKSLRKMYNTFFYEDDGVQIEDSDYRRLDFSIQSRREFDSKG